MNINQLFDLAKTRAQLKSDRALATQIGLSHGHLPSLRKGVKFPNDQTLIKLADLCGIDRREALLYGAIWRTPDGPIRETWNDLLREVNKSGVDTPTGSVHVL